MQGIVMMPQVTKTIRKKDYYSTAEIAAAFEVSQARIRQIRLELGLHPQEIGGTKLHSQEDFIAIALYIGQYKEIKIEFTEVA
jgi:hypothetical protein